MSETFHPFPRLPAELRLAIWKLAVRPGGKTLPGVHFFGILNPGEDGDAASLVEDSVSLSRRRPYRNYELVGPRRTTAPTEDRFVGIKHEPASWTDNNPSTYLIDCGLWLACKESRYMIMSALSPLCWQKPLIYENDAQRPKNAKGRFIAVFPGQDLFCFQPYNWYELDLLGGFSEFLISIFHGFVRNVGIEYDPQWGVEVEDAEGNHELVQIFADFFHIAISTASLTDAEAIWFVDYRIKRRHHVPTEEQQSEEPWGEVFYQNGRRFVEVDITCEDSPWEFSYEVAEDKRTSSKAFVLALRQACRDHVESGEGAMYSFDGEDEFPFLGVLACEDY